MPATMPPSLIPAAHLLPPERPPGRRCGALIVTHGRGGVGAAQAVLEDSGHRPRTIDEDGPKLARLEASVGRLFRTYDPGLIAKPDPRVTTPLIGMGRLRGFTHADSVRCPL